MRLKIGIITLQGNNYGATLQAVALNQVINHMGYGAENLDYNDLSRVKRGLSTSSEIKNSIWNTVRFILAGNKRAEFFQTFRDKYLILSKEKWVSQKELLDNPPNYDVYVSGSDQIWNPDVINGDYNYLLEFVPDRGKKISYASSFGKGKIQECYIEKYRQLLSQYQCLGVRESSGKELIEQLTGKEANVVLDPTLLLDDKNWEKLAGAKNEKGRYILCYYMPGDKIVNAAIKKISEALSRSSGLHIINLGLKEYYKLVPGMDCRINAGPGEFVRLFLDADYVITNSFHGTAFAINFGKKLCVPVNGNLDSAMSRHTRLIDFLKMVHRQNAIYLISEKNNNEIDFKCNIEESLRIIDKLRNDSLRYLKNAIEEEKTNGTL